MGQEMVSNWNLPFISSISVSPSGNCTAGKKIMHYFKWPGTVTFCACSYNLGLGEFYSIKAGICSQDDLNNNCTTYNPMEPVSFGFWRGRNTYCSQAMSTTFASQNIDCPFNTHRMCGFGDFKTCVLAEENCPITFATTTQTSLSPGLTNIPVGSSNYLSYGSIDGFYPLVKFGISQESFCALCTEYHLGLNNFEFMFSKNVCLTRCKTDPDYMTVDSLGERDFYTVNNFFEETQRIPGYPRVSNENFMVMGGKSAFAWKYSCRAISDYNLGVAQQRLENKDEKLISLIAVIFTGVALLFCGIIQPIKLFIYSKKEIDESPKKKAIYLGIDQVLKFGSFITILIMLWLSARDMRWFSNVIDNNCSSQFINENVLDSYKSLFVDLTIYYAIGLTIISALLIIDIYQTLKLWKDERRRKREAVKDVNKIAKVNNANKLPKDKEAISQFSSSGITDVGITKTENIETESHMIGRPEFPIFDKLDEKIEKAAEGFWQGFLDKFGFSNKNDEQTKEIEMKVEPESQMFAQNNNETVIEYHVEPKKTEILSKSQDLMRKQSLKALKKSKEEEKKLENILKKESKLSSKRNSRMITPPNKSKPKSPLTLEEDDFMGQTQNQNILGINTSPKPETDLISPEEFQEKERMKNPPADDFR